VRQRERQAKFRTKGAARVQFSRASRPHREGVRRESRADRASTRPVTWAGGGVVKEPCANLAGRTSLLEMAYIIGRSEFGFISNDSGPCTLPRRWAHRRFSFFGLKPRCVTARWARSTGFLRRARLLAVPFIHERKQTFCEIGAKCMSDIEFEEVWKAAREMLRGGLVEKQSVGASAVNPRGRTEIFVQNFAFSARPEQPRQSGIDCTRLNTCACRNARNPRPFQIFVRLCSGKRPTGCSDRGRNNMARQCRPTDRHLTPQQNAG